MDHAGSMYINDAWGGVAARRIVYWEWNAVAGIYVDYSMFRWIVPYASRCAFNVFKDEDRPQVGKVY